ncbi:MAG: hypothetical protein ACLP5H_19490 [Desulfomonilaceae bacterium]
MMTTNEKDERIRALKQDPDFRALVNALESQTPEQVESFYEHYEHSDGKGEDDATTEKTSHMEADRSESD